jgi:hypothetical protein
MAEGVVVSIHLALGATEPMRGVTEARAVERGRASGSGGGPYLKNFSSRP